MIQLLTFINEDELFSTLLNCVKHQLNDEIVKAQINQNIVEMTAALRSIPI